MTHRIAPVVMAGSLLMLASPALGQSLTQCTAFTTDLGQTRGYVATLEDDIQDLIDDLDTLASYVQIPLTLRHDVDDMKSDATYIADLLKDLALLADIYPEISEPLNNASTVVQNINRSAMAPTDKTVDDIVKALATQTIHDDLVAAARTLNRDAKAPVSKTKADLDEMIGWANQAMADYGKLPPNCQQRVRSDLDSACAAVDVPVKAVNTVVSGVTSYVTRATSSSNKATDTFGVLKPIKQDLDSVGDTLGALKSDFATIHSLLAQMITIKAAGITVAQFSILQVMHDFKKIVNTVNELMHINSAEKFLQDEMGKIMHPEVEHLKRTIEHAVVKQIQASMDSGAAGSQAGDTTSTTQQIKATFTYDNDQMKKRLYDLINNACAGQ